ncbi:MAG: hypothetical protein ACP5O2_03325 [Bacteroidales bacterium]
MLVKMSRKTLLAIGLVLVFSAPRLLQDLHRFSGHPHTLISCACANNTASCSLEEHKEACPICSFELFQTTTHQFIVLLPEIVLLRTITFGTLVSDYSVNNPYTVLPRAPPAAAITANM